ncbi:MAG TPA: ABC transporter ATP-binding protein [Gemmatimonadaceae bacterium]|nr:ABC transporter ATP-binding protein [Gemmatimonadaceae bacterium]
MTVAYKPEAPARDGTYQYRPPVNASNTPAAVSIRDLRKSFPARRSFAQAIRHPLSRSRATVIRGISFDVREGELFGILGLNGAGKTTLLKILATLIVPDAGMAEVGGHDVGSDAQAVREMAAMVTAEERSLNWRLSAFENLRLFAGLHRMRTADATSRIGEALASVGLSESGNKLVGSYSSGMRQRLLLARALLSSPRVLLMDEPTRSLDPLAAHEFRRMLRDVIVDKGGATVVLATHNAEEAFTYCDRVAVIHHGRVAALGSGRDLAARFAQNAYRIWTTAVDHPAFDALVRSGALRNVVRHPNAVEGSNVECVIAGDDFIAAEALRFLVDANVWVSRFERVELPLSSLIERIAAGCELDKDGLDA